MSDKGELGKRIKRVRESRHLTLKNIEASAGISATHISEIERGKTSPTLGALVRIAGALGKDASYFLEEEELGEVSLVTTENRIKESLAGGKGTRERLTTCIPGGCLQACLITLAPGMSRHEEAHTHFGDEAALVISGKVRFTIAEKDYDLEAEDAVHFDATLSHSYSNLSRTNDAVVLWLSTERSAT